MQNLNARCIFWQNQALSAKSPFSFGIDSEGNYGYIKEGADTVTPFKLNIKRTRIFSGNSLYPHTVNLKGYEGYKQFTINNFAISNAQITHTPFSRKQDNYGNILGGYNASTGILTLNQSTTYFTDISRDIYITYTVDLIQFE